MIFHDDNDDYFDDVDDDIGNDYNVNINKSSLSLSFSLSLVSFIPMIILLSSNDEINIYNNYHRVIFFIPLFKKIIRRRHQLVLISHISRVTEAKSKLFGKNTYIYHLVFYRQQSSSSSYPLEVS